MTKEDQTPRLSVGELKKGPTRREFLKGLASSVVKGAAVGGLTYVAGRAVTGFFGGFVKRAEEETREQIANLRELFGSLERKIAEEKERLEKHYTGGTLRIYEEMGIATPAEISEVEQILENYDEFEKNYSFTERAKEFKDRLDAKLLNADSTLEGYQPDAQRGINDRIRKLFGKKRGDDGSRTRDQIRGRLNELCRIYEANSDNRIAQGIVLEKVNDNLDKSKDLTLEEKDLYTFLREQAQKEGSGDDLRNFITNYNNFGEREEVLLRLRNSLTEAEELYSKIREDKTYVVRLQDLLKEGIRIKGEVRSKTASEVAAYQEQFEADIKKLRDGVYGTIDELEKKGYDIETRREYIKKGPVYHALERIVDPILKAGSVAVGGLAALIAFRNRRRTRHGRINDAALEEAVDRYNALAKQYDEQGALIEQDPSQLPVLGDTKEENPRTYKDETPKSN